MRILVLLGAPGAGKGTQADILARNLGLPRVATGDLFRAEVRAGTPLGEQARVFMDRGEFVPDQMTIQMLLHRLEAPEAAKGAILDGFPRNRAQAVALDEALDARGARVEASLYIAVPEAELLSRLSGRWLCEAHGHTYHDIAYPPRTPRVCDFDGSPLLQRDDDKSEVVSARLANQLAPLQDLVEYYRPRGVLRTVDGRRPIAAVTADLLDHLEHRPYWRGA